jgi:hypothetical protein
MDAGDGGERVCVGSRGNICKLFRVCVRARALVCSALFFYLCIFVWFVAYAKRAKDQTPSDEEMNMVSVSFLVSFLFLLFFLPFFSFLLASFYFTHFIVFIPSFLSSLLPSSIFTSLLPYYFFHPPTCFLEAYFPSSFASLLPCFLASLLVLHRECLRGIDSCF